MFEHDYENYPELSNKQLQDIGFTSPFVQYTEDFRATVIKVYDGDTISVATPDRDFIFPIRMLKINSREMGEGGEEAQVWLENQILNKEVDVLIDPENRVGKYGRLLGTIISQGLDVAQEQINLGLALPFGQEHEAEIPKQEKIFSEKQWF